MSESTPDERPAIAAAIIVHEGRVLLVRRRVAEVDLSWQFPAGEVESDETPEEASEREALEETGLVVRAAKRLGERRHPATGRTMIYVACERVSGTAHVADKDELVDVEWCDRETLSHHVAYALYGPVQDYLAVALAG